MGIFEKIFGNNEVPKDYAGQTEALKSAKVKERMTLARSTETNREILYYLAEKDPDPKVRKAVIENASMPVQVTPSLANDDDDDVRLALARRLIDLLPELSEDNHSQLYAFVVQALGTLALDEVLKIRVALSSTLKDHAQCPPKVAGQLARDVERQVSEPVLRFCAALSDMDLLDILKDHPASWVVEAVAGRDGVSEDVSEAVIKTEDRPGGKVLLENDAAKITEQLLVAIVEKARDYPEWQKPMAVRKNLPTEIAQELAEFVDSSVRDLLLARDDFDDDITEEISAIFKRRMEYRSADDGGESAIERIQNDVKAGKLSEESISDALAMRDQAYVTAAIAELAGIGVHDVTKVLEMRTPKPIIAVAWKAGLSMRMALQLQKDLGQVSPKELIYPRDGTDFPFTEEELNWQLEFLGLKAA